MASTIARRQICRDYVNSGEKGAADRIRSSSRRSSLREKIEGLGEVVPWVALVLERFVMWHWAGRRSSGLSNASRWLEAFTRQGFRSRSCVIVEHGSRTSISCCRVIAGKHASGPEMSRLLARLSAMDPIFRPDSPVKNIPCEPGQPVAAGNHRRTLDVLEAYGYAPRRTRRSRAHAISNGPIPNAMY